METIYAQWTALAAEDPDIAAELAEVKNQPAEIEDRFYRDLAFGTGGLRGVIGAGTNRMNIYTVRRATRGIAKWLAGQTEKRAVISYDSRIKSRRFAEEAARTFAACGIETYLFPQLMPTPALSFAVRKLHCGAGVMITASHNPAKYNGYKAYGPDGCQITTRAAKEITACIQSFGYFDPLPQDSAETVQEVSQSLFEDFYSAVLAQRLETKVPAPLKLVYSPLNGTGLVPVTTVLKRAGYQDITVVPSQEKPDGNFPTCPYPNPEIPEALAEGIKLCRETKADLLLATDPDCDRMGIAIRKGSDYVLLSGNEVGVLLLDYVCRRRIALGRMPEKPVAVKTIVTTEMAVKVAKHYGVELRNVLTGFKYIGEQIGLLEKDGEVSRYIFGFEESYGYLSGAHVRDKDAVNACLLLCDMAADYQAKGMSLIDAMEALYKTYGFYKNSLDSFAFEGEAGFHIMQDFMVYLRKNPPKDVCGHKIVLVKDYLHTPGKPVQFPALPSSDVLQYVLDDDTCLTIRPSGTEPKLKLYCAAVGKTAAAASAACEACRKVVSKIINDFGKARA
ncbi:MAG: phospho-sugar mutase [Oscillospiraceae bacterium]|jgi:phosphoglucomutase|nr:phospho-sugar mutase [Oscillospiraceae bacterium]MDD3261509.1 phospho-sugar mutase [Oscillospiraceae bacterium]